MNTVLLLATPHYCPQKYPGATLSVSSQADDCLWKTACLGFPWFIWSWEIILNHLYHPPYTWVPADHIPTRARRRHFLIQEGLIIQTALAGQLRASIIWITAWFHWQKRQTGVRPSCGTVSVLTAVNTLDEPGLFQQNGFSHPPPHGNWTRLTSFLLLWGTSGLLGKHFGCGHSHTLMATVQQWCFDTGTTRDISQYLPIQPRRKAVSCFKARKGNI